MNDQASVVVVGNVDVPVAFLGGNPVISLDMIDKIHGFKPGTAADDFDAQCPNLWEYGDYWVVGQGEKKRIFINGTGYAMLSKSWNRKEDFEAGRLLINVYFKGYFNEPQIEEIADKVDDLSSEIDDLSERMDELMERLEPDSLASAQTNRTREAMQHVKLVCRLENLYARNKDCRIHAMLEDTLRNVNEAFGFPRPGQGDKEV